MQYFNINCKSVHTVTSYCQKVTVTEHVVYVEDMRCMEFEYGTLREVSWKTNKEDLLIILTILWFCT
jgi:hypothetical protein